MKLDKFLQKCDALAFPAVFENQKDLDKFDYIQSLNHDFNQLFSKSTTVACVNYLNEGVKNRLSKEVDNLMNHHFKNAQVIHHRSSGKNIEEHTFQENFLIHFCKKLGYKFICKSMDHVLVQKEAFKLKIDPSIDFHYTCGVGWTKCEQKDNNIQDICDTEFFPQTNFYILNVSKVDYLYDLEKVKTTKKEWEKEPEKFNGPYYIEMEAETANMANRNNLSKRDIIPRDKFEQIIKNVIKFKIGDPSYKNLATCGITHFQHPYSPVYDLTMDYEE
jgi:hypothetical protein